MSQSSDSDDQDIPELTDIMVTGPDHHDSSEHQEHHAKAKRHKPHARKHGGHGDAHDDAPHVEPHPPATDDDDIPLLDSIYESPVIETPAPAFVPDAMPEPAQEPVHDHVQFVPGEAEFTSGSVAEHYVAPSSESPAAQASAAHLAASAASPDYDADVLAERLRGRFATYLKGEGRNLIEARCRDAFQDHTTWLVNQITREVALALETEMVSWVREAIREELVKHAADK